MKRYFESYKEAKNFVKKIGEENVVDYGKFYDLGKWITFVIYKGKKEK